MFCLCLRALSDPSGACFLQMNPICELNGMDYALNLTEEAFHDFIRVLRVGVLQNFDIRVLPVISEEMSSILFTKLLTRWAGPTGS